MPRWYKFYQLMNKDNGDGGGGGGSGNPNGEGEADDGEGEETPGETPPEGEGNDDKSGDGKVDIKTLPAAAQKLIKSLRKESAEFRSKAKVNGEKFAKVKGVLAELGLAKPDDEDPQETIKQLTNMNDETSLRNGILEAAIEHGIPKDGLDYFNFLVEKKARTLKEDEAVTDEMLSEIALEAKSKSEAGNKAPTRSGVGGGGQGGGGKPPAPNGGKPPATGDVTVEKFAVMGNAEKTELYSKNPDLFNKLSKEARTKRILTTRG